MHRQKGLTRPFQLADLLERDGLLATRDGIRRINGRTVDCNDTSGFKLALQITCGTVARVAGHLGVDSDHHHLTCLQVINPDGKQEFFRRGRSEGHRARRIEGFADNRGGAPADSGIAAGYGLAIIANAGIQAEESRAGIDPAPVITVFDLSIIDCNLSYINVGCARLAGSSGQKGIINFESLPAGGI